MNKHYINFPELSTIERLSGDLSPCYGAQVTYKDHVVVTMMNHRGKYETAIYEFVESPKETGVSEIACRLNRIEVAEKLFKDSGSAIKWGIASL